MMVEPDWKSLGHAYGSAEDLPEILAELEEDPGSFDWNELFSRVLHQYSTFSASMYVLPHILRAATALAPQERVMPLSLAGGIVACSRKTALKGFEDCIEKLRKLCIETLQFSELPRYDRLYIIMASVGFQGDRIWGSVFADLVSGEFAAKCPACNADLHVVIGEYGFFCAEGEWLNRPVTPRTPIQPIPPAELGGIGRDLHTLCAKHDETIAEWTCYVFGATTCPACKKAIKVPDAIAHSAFAGLFAE
jgi:hypothetical protein